MTYEFAKKYSNQIKLSLWHVWILYIFYFQFSETCFIAFLKKKWNHEVTQTRRRSNGYDYHLLYVQYYFENHWDKWIAAYMKPWKSHVLMYVPSNVLYNTQLNINVRINVRIITLTCLCQILLDIKIHQSITLLLIFNHLSHEQIWLVL